MIEYRGFRIDPQSRRIMEKSESEWRAHAMVYSSTKDTENASPMESGGLYPSEEAANAVAVELAKEWIDWRRESDWKEYEIYIDLYKHWMEITLKYTTFYYVVTGGIVSYYFTHYTNGLEWSLLVPVIMSGVYAAVAYLAWRKMDRHKGTVQRLRGRLQLVTELDFEVLKRILLFTWLLLIIVGLALLVLSLSRHVLRWVTPLLC